MDNHVHPQHKISDLIQVLTEKMNQHGDIPIVYWDQCSTVNFSNISNLTTVKDGVLYFGGFHMNGDIFCEFDPFISNKYADYPRHCGHDCECDQ
jgi:hypothetical protein